MAKRNETSIEERCAEIADFVRTHGHDRIPVRIQGRLNPLGQWCNQRRHLWRCGKLSPEVIAQLEAAGLLSPAARAAGDGPRRRARRARERMKAPKDTALPRATSPSRPRDRRRAPRYVIRVSLSVHDDHERLSQAARLVAEGVRPPLIQSLLALPESVVRRLWRAHHKRQAPGGQLPMGAASLLNRPRLAAHGAIFASCYLQHAGARGFASMNPTALIAGLDLYRQLVANPCITGVMAWYIARDLRNRDLLAYRLCPHCQAPHLTAPTGTHLRGCVFCQTDGQARRRSGAGRATPSGHRAVL